MRLLFAFVLYLFASSAWAACSQIPLHVLDASSNNVSMSSATAADGNCKTYIDADTSSQLHTDITAPIAAGTNLIGSVTSDPCATQVKLNTAIGGSGGNIQLVAGVSAKKVYICSLFVVGATAFVGNIIEGTGAACTTANEAAVIGSTTAASGVSLGANAGWTLGNGGGTIGVTATAANGICLLQSGTAALAGNMTYVQQ